MTTRLSSADYQKLTKRTKGGFNGEAALLVQIKQRGLPEPVTQFRFHPTRKWRSDLAYVEQRLLIEYDGGTWNASMGHSRGSSIMRDNEKHNTAALLGYHVMRFVDKQVKSGEAVAMIAEYLNNKTKRTC